MAIQENDRFSKKTMENKSNIGKFWVPKVPSFLLTEIINALLNMLRFVNL